MEPKNQIDLQHKTITRLVRENEILAQKWRKCNENAHECAVHILHFAIQILQGTRISNEDKKIFYESCREEIQRRTSRSLGNSSDKYQDGVSLLKEYDHTFNRRSLSDRSKSNVTNSYSRQDAYNDSRSIDNTKSNVASRVNSRSNENAARWIPENTGYTARTSEGGSLSLHESMLNTHGNSTSKWDTQSTAAGRESLARNLFPDNTPQSFNESKHSQIRHWTTTQHVGNDGVITQEIANPAHSLPTSATKLVLGENAIEIVRTQSPGQSDDGIRNVTTVASNHYKSSANSSNLFLSPLKDQSPSKEYSVDNDTISAEKQRSQTVGNHTVWDIPTDSFSGHKLSKTTFYGVPVDTSTPVRRNVIDNGSFKAGAQEISRVNNTEEQKPYTSSQLSEQHLTNGGFVQQVSVASDTVTNASQGQTIMKTIDDQQVRSIAPVSSPSDLNLVNLLQNIKLSKRLLGEIAFQLDRRIINTVFSGKHDKRQRKRLYGYSVQNIEAMIRRHAIDHTTAQIDEDKLKALERRYSFILGSLRPLGYCIEQHADFSMDMVNKYGLLPLRPGKKSSSTLNPTDNASLHKIIATLSAPHEVKDMTILVDCLALLAKDDGKPMIYW